MWVNNTKKNLPSWKIKLFFLILVVIFIFFLINLVKSLTKNKEINQEITNLQQDIVTLEQDNLKLEELIKYLNSGAYIEEKARLDLGLKKQGEKVVVVPIEKDANQTKGDLTNQPDNSNKSNSNFRKWWQFFFK